MHYFIHGFMLLEGLSALKPSDFQQRWLENQCFTLPESCLARFAFKSLSVHRIGA